MTPYATQIHHAEISTGAVLSARTGIAIPGDELVLVLTGDFDIGEKATAKALPLNPEISEFLLFTVSGTTGAVAVAIDLTQQEASEFMARGTRHGFPIMLVNEAGEAQRILKAQADLTPESTLQEMWRYQAMQRSPEDSKTFLRFIAVFARKMGEKLDEVETNGAVVPVQSVTLRKHVVINVNHLRHLAGKTVGDLISTHTIATQRATQEFRNALLAIQHGHRRASHQKA